MVAILVRGRDHNFGRGPSNDYFIKVWFQTRRFLCEFPIGSYVKLSSAVGAILIEGPNHRIHFWKRTIQWLFHQNFILIQASTLTYFSTCPFGQLTKPEALKSLYRSPGNKKNQLVQCKNYVLRHLGITINIKNTKFVKDLPMIDAQFRFNQCNNFREEYISVFSPYGSVLILWPVVAAILDFRSA